MKSFKLIESIKSDINFNSKIVVDNNNHLTETLGWDDSVVFKIKNRYDESLISDFKVFSKKLDNSSYLVKLSFEDFTETLKLPRNAYESNIGNFLNGLQYKLSEVTDHNKKSIKDFLFNE